MRGAVWKWTGIGALAAAAAAGVFVLHAARYTAADRILPGVTVGGVPVGGLTPGQAGRLLAAAHAAPARGGPGNGQQRRLRLIYEGQAWELPVGPLAPGPDLDRSVSQALAVGRSGGPLARALAFAAAALRGVHLPLQTAATPPVDLAPELAPIVAAVDRAPGMAAWDPDTGRWQSGAPGRAVDVAATAAAVRAAAAAGRDQAPLRVRPVPPSLSAAVTARLRVLARFETPVLQAEAGRLANIRLAAGKISGAVIAPGETFSFNGAVGPRTADLGWQPARELYRGEYIMGYGGGICQVSSTLYNAALLAGLEVVERHHHSRPLSYVPLGQDATVAWDYLDLKIKNTGPGPVAIGAGVTSGSPRRIVVSLYGPWEPAPARLETVTEQYLPPDYDELLDPSLPHGYRTVVDPGYEGYRVRVYRQSRGQRQPVGGAYYLPRRGKVIVGTGGMRLPPEQMRPQVR